MRILFSFIFILFSINYSIADDDVVGKLKIGQMIPEALGVDVDGNEILASNYRGKVMVISFWATWCPPCRKELPIIDNLQKLAGEERLKVLAVNFGEKKRTFKKFTEKLGKVNLEFTHDNKGKIGKKTYGIKAIPHMVIVDHEGKIAQVHSGYGDDTVNNLANEINSLFNKATTG
ncbi:MAG: TlpA family protein disulfide reductase [Kordiimonadaceae bacterium]|jgi:thiol-disulfide isomerase/thioredoxin|nr:TlpA family protein disulfide reductase [Kordiimonadaceae bacterium]MBT6033229.1 TlpA family protein disulfide reductase [Kordiimonadaceae bacterium]